MSSAVRCSSRSNRSFIAHKLTGCRADGKPSGERVSRGSSARLPSPIRAKQFRLLEYGLRRLLLLVRRITVLAKHSFHHHTQLSPNRFFRCPVNAHVLADGLQKLASDEAEGF